MGIKEGKISQIPLQDYPDRPQIKDPAQDVEEAYRQRELKDKVEESLAELDPEQRKVLELRLGLLDGQELSIKETAEALGLTEKQVKRLKERALYRLRASNIRQPLREFWK